MHVDLCLVFSGTEGAKVEVDRVWDGSTTSEFIARCSTVFRLPLLRLKLGDPCVIKHNDR